MKKHYVLTAGIKSSATKRNTYTGKLPGNLRSSQKLHFRIIRNEGEYRRIGHYISIDSEKWAVDALEYRN